MSISWNNSISKYSTVRSLNRYTVIIKATSQINWINVELSNLATPQTRCMLAQKKTPASNPITEIHIHIRNVSQQSRIDIFFFLISYITPYVSNRSRKLISAAEKSQSNAIKCNRALCISIQPPWTSLQFCNAIP